MEHETLARMPMEKIVEATIHEAKLAAELFSKWCHIVEGETGEKFSGVPLDFALRIAAWLRLIQFDRASILDEVVCDLPALQDVEQDVALSLQGEACENSGRDLCRKILWIRLTRMCLKSMPGTSLGLVLSGTTDEESVRELARFLWKHRNLVNTE